MKVHAKPIDVSVCARSGCDSVGSVEPALCIGG